MQLLSSIVFPGSARTSRDTQTHTLSTLTMNTSYRLSNEVTPVILRSASPSRFSNTTHTHTVATERVRGESQLGKRWVYRDTQDYSWLTATQLVDKINCVCFRRGKERDYLGKTHSSVCWHSIFKYTL